MPDTNKPTETQDNQNTQVQPDVQLSEDGFNEAVNILKGGNPDELRTVTDTDPDNDKDLPKEDAKTVQEDKPETTEQTEKEDGTPVFVVDDAFVEKYPVLKGLKGKSVEDIANSYSHINKFALKTAQENAQLKQQLAELNKSKPEEAKSKIEWQDLDELDAKGQQELIEKVIAERVEQALKGLQPQAQPKNEEQEEQRFLNELYSNVKNAVKPYVQDVEKYDLSSVMDDWRKDVGLLFADGSVNPDVEAQYNEMPEKLIFKEIALFAKERELKLLEKNSTSKAKKQTAEKVVDTLRKASDNAPEIKSTAHKRNDVAPTQDEEFAAGLFNYVQNNYH